MTAVMHFYTTRTDEPVADYIREADAGHVYPPAPHALAVPLYRWLHEASGHHFYTLDDGPVAGWKSEGVACYMPVAEAPGAVPFYRWFHPGTGDHFYTRDPHGELAPGSGYQQDGPQPFGWIYPSPKVDTVPLRRFVTGTQQWCIRLSRQGSTVFAKNFSLASYEAAVAQSEVTLHEYRQIHGYAAADAYVPPKLGGCDEF